MPCCLARPARRATLALQGTGKMVATPRAANARQVSSVAPVLLNGFFQCTCQWQGTSTLFGHRGFTITTTRLTLVPFRYPFADDPLPGYYNAVPGGSSRDVCIPCSPGLVSAPGSSSCGLNCPPGNGATVHPAPDACPGCSVCSTANPSCAASVCPSCSACSECPAGQFSTGLSGCKPCPAGWSTKLVWRECFWCTDLAQLACRNSLLLSTGTYSAVRQSAECPPCPRGLVSGPGAASCTSTCQAGTGTRTSNLRACVQCPIGAVNLETSLRTYCGTLVILVQSGALHCTPFVAT
jgi:hypothetical protein